MVRWALVFSILTGTAAEAGQARSSFQVGLTITGRANTFVPAAQSSATAKAIPLPRPRPARRPVLTTSDTSARSSNELGPGEKL